jgi:hypothetical protein
MFFPLAWGFRVALHGRSHWDYVVGGKWGVLPVLHPPFHKGAVRADEETLLGWWGLCKCVGDVGTKDK